MFRYGLNRVPQLATTTPSRAAGVSFSSSSYVSPFSQSHPIRSSSTNSDMYIQQRNFTNLPQYLPSTRCTPLPTIQKRFSHKINKNSIRLTIIGAPGSGKGTQSTKIERDFGLSTISTGQILRQIAAEQTDRGSMINSILTSGGLVGDDIMLDLIKGAVSSQSNGWLLDGYPRNPKQAAQLDELLDGIMQPLSLVFHLQVPEEVLLERIQERWVHLPSGRTYNMSFSPPKVAGMDDVTGEPLVKRVDDNPASLQARLRTFHEATEPLIEYYRKIGKLITVESPTSTVGYVKIKQVLQDMVQL